jgi:hypothetical protein
MLYICYSFTTKNHLKNVSCTGKLVVECLLNMYKALGQIPSTTTPQKRIGYKSLFSSTFILFFMEKILVAL